MSPPRIDEIIVRNAIETIMPDVHGNQLARGQRLRDLPAGQYLALELGVMPILVVFATYDTTAFHVPDFRHASHQMRPVPDDMPALLAKRPPLVPQRQREDERYHAEHHEEQQQANWQILI